MIRRTPANLVAVTENPHCCRRSRHRSRREVALAVALVVASLAASDAVAAASLARGSRGDGDAPPGTRARRSAQHRAGRPGDDPAGRCDAPRGASESRGRRDDPARQRPGEPDGDPFASAHRRRILRRVPVPRERRADPAGRLLQRQRALRGQHRAGAGDRGAARARQRAVRLERHARHRQRDPASAGRAAAARHRRGRRASRTTGASRSRVARTGATRASASRGSTRTTAAGGRCPATTRRRPMPR